MMLPFQTLKNEVRKMLLKHKRRTGEEYKPGTTAVKELNKLIGTFAGEIIDLSIEYAKNRGGKVLKDTDVQLAYQVLHNARRY